MKRCSAKAVYGEADAVMPESFGCQVNEFLNFRRGRTDAIKLDAYRTSSSIWV